MCMFHCHVVFIHYVYVTMSSGVHLPYVCVYVGFVWCSFAVCVSLCLVVLIPSVYVCFVRCLFAVCVCVSVSCGVDSLSICLIAL